MRWRIILEEFGPDIQDISGEDKVVADAMSRLPTTNKDQREQSTDAQDPSSKTLAKAEIFILDEEESFLLDLSLVQRLQNIELNKRKSKMN